MGEIGTISFNMEAGSRHRSSIWIQEVSRNSHLLLDAALSRHFLQHLLKVANIHAQLAPPFPQGRVFLCEDQSVLGQLAELRFNLHCLLHDQPDRFRDSQVHQVLKLCPHGRRSAIRLLLKPADVKAELTFTPHVTIQRFLDAVLTRFQFTSFTSRLDTIKNPQ